MEMNGHDGIPIKLFTKIDGERYGQRIIVFSPCSKLKVIKKMLII